EIEQLLRLLQRLFITILTAETGHRLADGDSGVRHRPNDGGGCLQRLAQLVDRDPRYHRNDVVARRVDLRADLLQQVGDLLRLHGDHDDVRLAHRLAVVRSDTKPDLGEVGQLVRITAGDADLVGRAEARLRPTEGEGAAQIAATQNGDARLRLPFRTVHAALAPLRKMGVDDGRGLRNGRLRLRT